MAGVMEMGAINGSHVAHMSVEMCFLLENIILLGVYACKDAITSILKMWREGGGGKGEG